jgi:hypothetical protein
MRAAVLSEVLQGAQSRKAPCRMLCGQSWRAASCQKSEGELPFREVSEALLCSLTARLGAVPEPSDPCCDDADVLMEAFCGFYS